MVPHATDRWRPHKIPGCHTLSMIS
jgi:hypothetical protein